MFMSFAAGLLSLSLICQVKTETAPLHDKPKEKRTLGFDLREARNLLDARSSPLTSPHFENPFKYQFGIGKARHGLIWGSDIVSVELESGMTFRTGNGNSKFDVNSLAMELQSLKWDEDDLLYKGIGTVYGKTHKHCPVRAISFTAKVRINEVHPFQGALSQMELEHDAWEENQKCERTSEVKKITSVYSRIYVVIEYLRALEQADQIWTQGIGALRGVIADLKGLTKHSKRVQQITNAVEEKIDSSEKGIRDLIHVLKWGGKYKNDQYDKLPALSEMPSALALEAGMLFQNAVEIESSAKDLRNIYERLKRL